MPFPKHPARQKRCRGDRTAARIWSATLETVNLRLDQLQLRESHWVIVDTPEGRTTATVPVPAWGKDLMDVWIHDTGVTEGKVFRRVSKNGTRQDEGVTTDMSGMR
jgi:integrase/recombinase XerD